MIVFVGVQSHMCLVWRSEDNCRLLLVHDTELSGPGLTWQAGLAGSIPEESTQLTSQH